MRRLVIALAALVLAGGVQAKAAPRNVVLVTMDGVRWHEVFEGADPVLVANPRHVDPDLRHDGIAPALVDVPDRAAALMPFVHGVIARSGVLWGDRRAGECARITNPWAVSYPGYNEFLTGHADPAISGNEPIDNPNVTVLERLNRMPAFAGRVGIAGNWDIFPQIFNTKRSHLPVNTGLAGRYPSDVRVEREAFRLLDAHMRVVYLALGDTDEDAHAGNYAMVLGALEHADAMLERIWAKIEADPFYRGRTTLIVTTDHGRGESTGEGWREHGTVAYYRKYPADGPEYVRDGVPGSTEVWFAALGPGVGRARPAPGECATSAQVAASVMAALGQDWHALGPQAAPPFAFIRP